MSKELTATEWGRLPFWVRARIEEMGATNKEQWILRRIPALGWRSIADLARSDEGQALLRDYFANVIGR